MRTPLLAALLPLPALTNSHVRRSHEANTRRNSSAHGTRPVRVPRLGVAAVGGGPPAGAGTSARS